MRVLLFLASATLLLGCSTPRIPQSSKAGGGISQGIEDIFVFRTLRIARSAPDAFCAESTTGFKASVMDRYTLRAVVTRASDGRVVDAAGREVGTMLSCFGKTPGADDVSFYSVGVLAGVVVTGKGKCTTIADNVPEPGITSVRCFQTLSNLSQPYIAGVATSNTVASRELIGDHSDPAGYTQLSIVTIRLWRR